LVSERTGTRCCRSKLRMVHFLSYTEAVWNFWPDGSVPLAVTVRLLPSIEMTMRPLVVTLPPFLTLNPNVRSFDLGIRPRV